MISPDAQQARLHPVPEGSSFEFLGSFGLRLSRLQLSERLAHYVRQQKRGKNLAMAFEMIYEMSSETFKPSMFRIHLHNAEPLL